MPGKDDTLVESGMVVSGTGHAAVLVLVRDIATGTACLNVTKGPLSNKKGGDFTY